MKNQRNFYDYSRMVEIKCNIFKMSLIKCRKLYKNIFYLRQELDAMNNCSLIKANVFDTVKVQGGLGNNMVEKFGIRHHDTVVELERKIKELEREMTITKNKLDALSKEEYRQVLTLYYLESKNTNEIADIMGYSTRHIVRLKKEALVEFSSL